jgi:hypothetical protein
MMAIMDAVEVGLRFPVGGGVIIRRLDARLVFTGTLLLEEVTLLLEAEGGLKVIFVVLM